MEKALFDLFGPSAVALRFPSFLATTAAFLFLADAVRRLLPGIPAVLVIVLAAIAPLPIYYGAEVKHYAFDLLGASALVWLLALRQSREHARRLILPFNLVALLVAPFSFPYVFYAVAIQATLALQEPKRKKRLRMALKLSPWMLIFGLLALWSITRLDEERRESYGQMWELGFWPLFSLQANAVTWPVEWLLDFYWRLFPLMGIPILALVITAVGMVAVCRSRHPVGLAMVATLVLVAAASALKVYPPWARLALFLYPALLILLGYGIQAIGRLPRHGNVVAIGLGMVLIATAFVFSTIPLFADGRIAFGHGTYRRSAYEDIRAGVRIARENAPADTLFLIPRFTIPAYAFHHADDMIPPDRVWLERVPPRSERGDIRINPAFIIWHDESRFSEIDNTGKWDPSPALQAVMQEAITTKTALCFIVTEGNNQVSNLMTKVAEQLGPPEEFTYPGGCVYLFKPNPGAMP
jgi:hypothetical protein